MHADTIGLQAQIMECAFKWYVQLGSSCDDENAHILIFFYNFSIYLLLVGG